MNKKGILMRDIIFMLVLFGGVMAFASIIVYQMAGEYGVTNQTTEYAAMDVSSLGEETSGDINSSISDMRIEAEKGDGVIGTFLNIVDIVKGASTIVKIGFTSPFLIANIVDVFSESLGMPDSIKSIIYFIVVALLYALLIFVIITAALRGSKL